MRRALAVPGFTRLYAAIATSGLGDAVMLLVLGMWVRTLTGSNALAGATFAFMVLPALAAPVLGALVDRLPRRRVVVVGNLASAVAVAPLLLVHDAAHVWVVWAVAFCYGVSFVVVPAACSALLKDVVPDDTLADANGLVQTTKEAFRLVGPMVGAALFARYGGAAVAVVDIVSFLLAAALAARVDAPEEPGAHGARAAGERVVGPLGGDLLAGVRWIARDRILRQVTAGVALMLLVVGFSESTLFAMLDAFSRPPTDAALVVTVQSVGAVASGALCGRLVHRIGEPATVAAGLVALAVAALAVAAAPTFGWALAGAVLVGVALPPVFVGFTTVQQRRTPARLLGRVATAAELLLAVPQALSVAAGALLVLVVGYRVVWAGMGVVILAAGLLVVLTLPDAVRAGPVVPVTDADPHAPAPEPVVATPADAVAVAAAVSETTRHQVDS